jgi:hypothetical protein
MNRKKALIAILGLQMMLLAMIVALFVSGVLNITLFILLVLIVGLVFSTLTVVAVRKLPLE